MNTSLRTTKEHLGQFILVVLACAAANYFKISIKDGVVVSGLEACCLAFAFSELFFALDSNKEKTLAVFLVPMLLAFLGFQGRNFMSFLGTSPGVTFLIIYSVMLYKLIKDGKVKPESKSEDKPEAEKINSLAEFIKLFNEDPGLKFGVKMLGIMLVAGAICFILAYFGLIEHNIPFLKK